MTDQSTHDENSEKSPEQNNGSFASDPSPERPSASSPTAEGNEPDQRGKEGFTKGVMGGLSAAKDAVQARLKLGPLNAQLVAAWEKNGNDWRVVVRGLRKDNVAFRDAWVSPTGNVYAITDTPPFTKNKLYQLK